MSLNKIASGPEDADKGFESNTNLLTLYHSANSYLDEGLIRLQTPTIRSCLSRRQWMESFLPHLENPQNAYPAIHIAGTSGKGSVAIMIAEILCAAGLHTGLHISPYLQASTEKLWIDGLYASPAEFHELVEWIKPRADAFKDQTVPMHGMASVAIALEYFRRLRVKLAVIEAGVGGRHDLTKVLQTQLAVIASIGWDHLKALGPHLEDIAWHKVGIIQPGCQAVMHEGPAIAAARAQCAQVQAKLREVKQDEFKATQSPDGTTTFSFRGKLVQIADVSLGMKGSFQALNAALAVASAEELVKQGWTITSEAVRYGLSQARLPARFEVLLPETTGSCPVILDGAHNSDKLMALLRGIQALSYRKLHIIYGGLASRLLEPELNKIFALADTLILTEPTVYGKPAWSTTELQSKLSPSPQKKLLAISHPAEAVSTGLRLAHPKDLLLITGSLYMCGEIRNTWFPLEHVLINRRSW